MNKAEYIKYTLNFKNPSGTSRGVLTEKPTYFIKIWEEENPYLVGIGECSILKGLSIDDVENYEEKLVDVCLNINNYIEATGTKLAAFPSIIFGIETALKDFENGGKRVLFPSDFTDGIEGISIRSE